MKVPRARRKAIITAGCPRIYCSWQDNRPGVLLAQGPDQSIVYFDEEADEGEHLPRESIMPNGWFKRGSPPRVRLRTERVMPVTKRVRLK